MYTGYNMISKMTRRFILILVSAYLVTADDLQGFNYTGKTHSSLNYHKIMC